MKVTTEMFWDQYGDARSLCQNVRAMGQFANVSSLLGCTVGYFEIKMLLKHLIYLKSPFDPTPGSCGDASGICVTVSGAWNTCLTSTAKEVGAGKPFFTISASSEFCVKI
jgi:hypothetical protein